MKSIITPLLFLLLCAASFAQQGTDSTITSQVWQGSIQWQGQAQPTNIYLLVKSDSSVQMVSFDDNRVVKDKGKFDLRNGHIIVMFADETVILDAVNNGSQLSGTCTNSSGNTTGSWTVQLLPEMTENALNQLVIDATSKKR